MGSAVPQRDVPRLLALYEAGKLLIDRLYIRSILCCLVRPFVSRPRRPNAKAWAVAHVTGNRMIENWLPGRTY
jgi:hypothetical protein